MKPTIIVLITLAMCGGPKDPKCDETYIQDVKHYTMDQCLNIFKDYMKCDQLSNDREAQLRERCEF